MKRATEASTRRARAMLGVVTLVFVGGCHAKAGERCQGERQTCADDHTALYCSSGVYRPISCDGPSGCKEDPANARAKCDISGARDGASCPERFNGREVCRPDGKSKIACHDGRYGVERCRGPKGCASGTVTTSGEEQDVVKSCDQSRVAEGDVCRDAGLLRCSADGDAALRCRNGRFALVERCNGPKGCITNDDNGSVAACDARHKLGEACFFAPKPQCSDDGLALVVCHDGRIGYESCKGPQHCHMSSGNALCDDGYDDVGGSCGRDGDTACVRFSVQTLLCKDGHYVEGAACAKGERCVVGDKGGVCARVIAPR